MHQISVPEREESSGVVRPMEFHTSCFCSGVFLNFLNFLNIFMT